MNEETLFHLALEKAPGDRSALLDVVCEADAELRSRVERLLDEHERGESFILDTPPAGLNATMERPLSERSGDTIGPFKLLQQIGEGGMGVVFMAEQTEPIQRTVALKIIKPGMDTRQVIARFEAERQALAMMDHPNIAKVLDAGTTSVDLSLREREFISRSEMTTLGRPYFVMELVKGVPITKYCDEKQLPLRTRLELFVQVCQAVQHAHQKGIIHRDIKPNNVLVAEYDNQAVPKVIDFGVAKATAQKLTERTMFTEFGQVLGTMEYMSPEQAKLNQLDVDTRSDVYSLGVLLYELLAGSTPFEGKRLHAAAFDEMLRIIREEDPPKPSSRLSSLSSRKHTIDSLPLAGRVGEGVPSSLASIAVNRQTEPARLSKDVQGELDWIVMKALEKDRNRRYETASGFAADIERHLHDEPVEAGPPSAAYRFRKFARRNKVALATATVMSLALLVAVGSIGWVLRDRSARQNELNYRVQLAVEDGSLARDRALTQTGNRFQWEVTLAAALSALKRGEELSAQDRAALDPAIAGRLHELRATLDADARDYRFVIRLDEILQGVIVWDAHRSRSKSEESLLKMKEALKSHFGWDIGVTPTAEVARFVEQRPKPIQEYLLAALDVCLARAPQDDSQARSWLGEVLQAADSDPWRKKAREALAAGDWPVLEKLLQEVTVSRQPPALLSLLSSYLPNEAYETKTELFYRIRDAYPDEFWAHGRFAIALSHDVLAWSMADQADPQSRKANWAVALAREAVRLVPNDADFWNTLGVAHYRAGNWNEAVAALEKAMDLSNGGRADDWFNLAMAHWRLGNKDDARRWFDQAVEWTQTHEPPWYNAALIGYQAEAAELINQEPAGGNEKSESKIIPE